MQKIHPSTTVVNPDLPPHSEQFEKEILGLILEEPTKAYERLSQLDLSDFYEPAFREIFCILNKLKLEDRAVEFSTLISEAKKLGKLDAIGGHALVSSILDAAGENSSGFGLVLPELKEVTNNRKEDAKYTRLIQIAEQAKKACQTGQGIDAIANELREQLGATIEPQTRAKLTLRKPDEILAMQFDDSDIILGDRLLAKGQSLVIAAAGGTGKSRLLLQLAASVTSGRSFLALSTYGESLRWLILQTENSNRRLQSDLSRVKAWLGDDWAKFDEQVLIHTIESDTDGFVSLDNMDNLLAIESAICESKPNIICIDPLNDFGIGDLNKDADMKMTLATLSRVCRRGDPERSIIALHHALTGKAGASKTTGHDRASFARNSKALHAWTRAQINIAAVDPDNNDRLVIACGKSNNGREFAPFGVKMNMGTFIYELDPSIDVQSWQSDMSGKGNRDAIMTPERVRELCNGPMKKADLVKAITEDCGIERTNSYRYITKAIDARKIKFSNGCYTPR